MGDRHLSAKPAEAPAGKTAEKHNNSKELQMAPMNKRRNVGMEENKEVQEGTLLSILAYLGVLVLVPFIIGKDTDYGQICKIYSIPFKGRAKAVSSGLGPGPALEYFAYYYNGPDKDKIQAVYTEFRNTPL